MTREARSIGTPNRARRSAAAMVAAGVIGAGLSGCAMFSTGATDLPLPGGADLGESPYALSANFTDVLDLVPQSSVNVDNVSVGRVSKITLNSGGRSARVAMEINGDVQLPAGTTARVQQTSLLGEKYVALTRPAKPSAGAPLSNGDDVPLASTSSAVGVEQVLGALSLVLNGGGIGQFQQISRELQAVSTGRPGEIRDFLETMNTFTTTLDENKKSITEALDGVAQLSTTLNLESGKIRNALNGLSPGLKTLEDQRGELVTMLKAFDRLSAVTVSTLNASQEDIVADLKLLDPILKQLAASGADLPNSLEILLTYPFPDSVLKAIKGDYLNVFMVTNFNTPGGDWLQQTVNTVSAPSGAAKSSAKATNAPPVLLPPTSSPTPGSTEPTVTAPTPTPTEPAPTEPTPTEPSPSPTEPSASATEPSTPPTTGTTTDQNGGQ